MNSYLKCAKDIGEKICADAIWSNSMCNWMGAISSVDETPEHTTDGVVITNSALDPYMYSGTSGIAYFLSFLYKITGIDTFRKTCFGAINQAQSKLDDLPPELDSGFYLGKIGLVYSTIKVGINTDDDSLVQKGYDDLIQTDFNPDNSIEVLDGYSGSIPALIEMFGHFDDERILNLALLMGDQILKQKTVEPVGWSWSSPGPKLTHNLTGYAHGASGMGCSLLELYRITDDAKYLEGAKNAFAYEDYWYDKTNKNWPDFRESFQDNEFPSNDFDFAVGWCNGSPGIGMTRMRAYSLLQDKKYTHYMSDSAQTSELLIKEVLHDDYDFTLCHGLCGLGDQLLYYQKTLPDFEMSSLLEEIGTVTIHNFANSSLQYGLPNEQSPGLLLGLSGIGYFLLRLYDESVPSVLFIPENL